MISKKEELSQKKSILQSNDNVLFNFSSRISLNVTVDKPVVDGGKYTLIMIPLFLIISLTL